MPSQSLGLGVRALVCSSQLSLLEWEVYVPSRARRAQGTGRRWQRFMGNRRPVRVKSLSVPLVLVAIHRWKGRRLYLALDTMVLWNPIATRR